MKREILNINFLSAVSEKAPNKTKLANLLVNILQIEKEAVYRRLRGEVPFTFAEVAIISEKLGISLDNIIGIKSHNSRPFTLILNDFTDPKESDYIMCDNYLSVLKILKRDPDSEVIESWNALPFPMCYCYENIMKFYIFRWNFQFRNSTPITKFEDIVLPARMKEIQLKHLEEFKNINHTHFIFDRNIFHNLLLDIEYFHTIRLLSKENVRNIKKELQEFLTYCNHLMITGNYPETGNRVSIYLSGINIDTNYSYIETRGYKLSMIRTLVLNAATSPDELSFDNIKSWLQALRRLSTLISVTGEKQRIEFIDKQQKLIEEI